MGANLSRIIICDVESTCWETDEERGSQPMEIIEIGICEVRMKTGEIQNKRSYKVRPVFTKISPFCTQLTGWKPEDFNDAPTIEIVLSEIFKDYKITKNDVWCSYGEFDRYKLSSDLNTGGVYDLYGISPKSNPFSRMRAHLNLKTLMALKHRFEREIGMARALKFYGLELEGRHHNGADDAYNIAKIALKVFS